MICLHIYFTYLFYIFILHSPHSSALPHWTRSLLRTQSDFLCECTRRAVLLLYTQYTITVEGKTGNTKEDIGNRISYFLLLEYISQRRRRTGTHMLIKVSIVASVLYYLIWAVYNVQRGWFAYISILHFYFSYLFCICILLIYPVINCFCIGTADHAYIGTT